MQKFKIGPMEWVLLIALSVIWGGSYLFMKIAVSSIPVLTIVFARVGLGALVLGLALILTKTEFPHTAVTWRALIGMGLLNNVIPMSLIVYGTSQIDAGLASIINAMTPLFTIVIAHFATQDESMTLNRLIGVGLGVAGVIVLIGPGLIFDQSMNGLGEIACLAATISYAASSIYGRRFARMNLKPMQIAFGQTTSASFILLPFSLFIDQPWTRAMPPVSAWASVLALGVLCTAFAYLLYFRILHRSGAVAVALVTLLIPPSALLLGIVVLGERLSTGDILGMVLIGLGLAIVNLRRKSSSS